ncbi:MAG: amidohydrolase family protein [Polyangiaceae bacterium]
MLDLSGRAVLPGLVGMHNHLYYSVEAGPPGDSTALLPELFYSAPRLYLAGGVTTMRTTGCVEPYADLNLRRLIDEGKTPGPAMDVTAPYLEGPGGFFPQMPVVRTAAEARKFVAFWADQGATSIKAYMNISRDALKAAIDEAHRRKLKVTGHLCSVTYAEAASLGIDDLEHGFFEATDYARGKKSDRCPEESRHPLLSDLAPDGPEAKALIRTLVTHHVALTSTLPVFEQLLPKRPQDLRGIALLTPELRARYEDARKEIDSGAWGGDFWPAAYKNDLRLERAFVAAGGVLLAGPDPTGDGGVIPGFGDQHGIELLVEAGFSPVEAIHIATYNGAAYLGRLDTIGTAAKGKQADLVVVRGDPGAHIEAIESVEWVFRKGVGYDPAALIDSVRGTVGLY